MTPVPRVARISPPRLHWPRRTARLRFTAVYGGLFLVSGLALVAVTYALFQRATELRQPQLPAVPHAPAIKQPRLPTLPSAFANATAKTVPGLPAALATLTHDQYRLTQDGNTLRLSLIPQAAGAHPLSVGLAQLTADQHQLATDQHQLAQSVRELAQAVHQLSQAGSVQQAQRTADAHQLLVDAGIALAVVAVLALVAGWFVAGRMLRPIRTIIQMAQRISSTSLHERLALRGPRDELKELADTLDARFGRLEAAFAAQRHFVANASHELRSPLARQRALIQVALADPDASYGSLRAAHERALASEQQLEQTIDALLTLSRGQAGVERCEPLDLAALASRALGTLAPEAQARGVAVHPVLAPAPATGDPRLVERLIANLIENAIRHNITDGTVELSTAADAGRAYLAIANTGPPVPPDQIERLFEPFQRLSGARTQTNSGHGLGLAIVSAIADAHHAQISTEPRPQGGLTIVVTFPSPTGSPSMSVEPTHAARRERAQARIHA